jgi:tetratricopeptide (TPR) repeat protein
VVYVSLASEDDYHLKETFLYMKNTIGDETDLDSLGKILTKMGEYEQAQKCYKRMIDETKLVLGNAETGFGLACLDCKMDDESLEHLEEALKIRQSLLGQDHADVAECYSYIGIVHWSLKEDFDQALVNLQKAMEIQEKTLPSDSLALAKTYNNIANTYYLTQKYDLALKYYDKTLKIRQKVLPSNHSDIAITYNNLGRLYMDKEDFSKALEYFKKSLEISRQALPPTHPDIIRTENNIRKLKEQMKQ